MDDFKLDPTNFTPRANPPKTAPNTPAEAVSLPTLSALEAMDRKALHDLLQRVCGARWGEVATMSPEAIVEAFKLKLAHGGLTEKDMFKALPIMREWFDRELGKAPQSIKMTVKDDGLNKLTTDKLLRLASMLDDPVIIAPLPASSSS